jgi:hypothetical protein
VGACAATTAAGATGAALGVGTAALTGAAAGAVAATGAALGAATGAAATAGAGAAAALAPAPSSTTTTLPPQPEPYVAVGESVMLGAAPQLRAAGVVVDAAEKRGFNGTREAIAEMRNRGTIAKGTMVIVQVGTNGPISVAQYEAIIAELPTTVKAIAFMTLHSTVQWISGNNDNLRALQLAHPEIHIIDWDAESAKIKLCPDETHISCSIEATNFYANLLLAEFGLPAIK